MLAAIENLSDSALTHLISRVEKRLEPTIKPMQVFVVMVDDVLVQARGSIMDESLAALRIAGEQAGLDAESIERILRKRQTLYRAKDEDKRAISAFLTILFLILMACIGAGVLWWLMGEWQQFQENTLPQTLKGSVQNLEKETGKQTFQLQSGSSLLQQKKDDTSIDFTLRKPESTVSVTTMLSIPGGRFVMGSTGYSNVERPTHSVTIQSFQLGETEVTWAQYQGCIDSGSCSPHVSDQGWGKANRPVMNVSWNDVQRYIRWLNQKSGQRFRLPSEAEWEYAARAIVGKGGSKNSSDYSWGDDIGENNANCDGCGSPWDDRQTAPVASFSANAFGLYDMHGNVWEWVEDCWHDNYNGAPSNGDAWETASQTESPSEPCRRRVLRGGSWHNVRGYLRSAYRSADSVESTYFNFGFRLAHD